MTDDIDELARNYNGLYNVKFRVLVENFFVFWSNPKQQDALYALLNDASFKQSVMLPPQIQDYIIKEKIPKQKISVYRMNALFLHALIHPLTEWSPSFRRLLVKIILPLEAKLNNPMILAQQNDPYFAQRDYLGKLCTYFKPLIISSSELPDSSPIPTLGHTRTGADVARQFVFIHHNNAYSEDEKTQLSLKLIEAFMHNKQKLILDNTIFILSEIFSLCDSSTEYQYKFLSLFKQEINRQIYNGEIITGETLLEMLEHRGLGHDLKLALVESVISNGKLKLSRIRFVLKILQASMGVPVNVMALNATPEKSFQNGAGASILMLLITHFDNIFRDLEPITHKKSHSLSAVFRVCRDIDQSLALALLKQLREKGKIVMIDGKDVIECINCLVKKDTVEALQIAVEAFDQLTLTKIPGCSSFGADGLGQLLAIFYPQLNIERPRLCAPSKGEKKFSGVRLGNNTGSRVFGDSNAANSHAERAVSVQRPANEPQIVVKKEEPMTKELAQYKSKQEITQLVEAREAALVHIIYLIATRELVDGEVMEQFYARTLNPPYALEGCLPEEKEKIRKIFDGLNEKTLALTSSDKKRLAPAKSAMESPVCDSSFFRKEGQQPPGSAEPGRTNAKFSRG